MGGEAPGQFFWLMNNYEVLNQVGQKRWKIWKNTMGGEAPGQFFLAHK